MPSAKIVALGSISFFSNLPRGHVPEPDEAVALAGLLRERFEAGLQESVLAGELVVVRTEYAFGCLITTLTLGATVAGLYKFIKDYEDFRAGLLKLIEDLNGIRLRLKRFALQASTWTYDAQIPTARSLEKTAEKAVAGQLTGVEVTREITERTGNPGVI